MPFFGGVIEGDGWIMVDDVIKNQGKKRKKKKKKKKVGFESRFWRW
jgi:hypothetical protein